MARYGVGIIGAGWVAGEYAKVFRDHPLAEVVGLHDLVAGKAGRLATELGIDAREYLSIDELFADERISLIVSCTYPDTRVEHCVRAAETGRHIVIEKPVGLGADDARQIRDAVAKAGVKTVTSFVLRWTPQFVAMRELIDGGELGELVYGEGDYWAPVDRSYTGYAPLVSRAQGGSAFVAAGGHVVDILRFLVGEIVEVSAFSAAAKINRDFEYDPTVVAALRFAGGAPGKLSTMFDVHTPYTINCRLFGTEGSIQNNEVFSPGRGDDGYRVFATAKPDSADVAAHPFRQEIEHFVDCIENDVESHASIQDTYKTMAVCDAIDESAVGDGQPVRVMLD